MYQPNPAAPQKLRIAERRKMALALRIQGGSYRQIAENLKAWAASGAEGSVGFPKGYSEGLAYRDVMDELKKLNAAKAEVAEEVRRLELERLDALFAVYWPKAGKGDYAALDRILEIMAARARYLNLYQGGSRTIELANKAGETLAVKSELTITEMIVEMVSGDEDLTADNDEALPLPENGNDEALALQEPSSV